MITTATFFNKTVEELNETNPNTGLTLEEELALDCTKCASCMGAYSIEEALDNAMHCVNMGFEDITILKSVVCINTNYVVLAK